MVEIIKDIYHANKVGVWLWLEGNKLKFKTPQNVDCSEIIEKLRQNKNEIAIILDKNQVFDSKSIEEKIYKIDDTQTDISFAQERVWFIEEFEQGTNAYHIPMLFELDVHIKLAELKRAFQQIVLRHDVLRSTIRQVNDEDHQVLLVHDDPLSIEEVKLNDKKDYESIIRADINQPFDLRNEYPIRVKLYAIQSDKPATEKSLEKTILLINFHHIASDGWSVDIFLRELIAYYEAYVNGNLEFRLPELEIQYKDYAVWQRAHLSGEIFEEQLRYWKDKLSGYQTLELPTDFMRPNKIDYRGASFVFSIEKEISGKLRSLARECGSTLHSVLLSGLAILLSKYACQDDIVIGSPIANRHHRQTEGLIGFFVNTLVNRILLKGNHSYKELIRQVHQEQIEAQLHQDLPFEKLMEVLEVVRDTTRHPIFQVMFGVQSFGDNGKAVGQVGRFLKPYHLGNLFGVEKFDLSIYIDDSGEVLQGYISYATGLFKTDTIERFVAHFQNLLLQLTESPEKPYSRLCLLSSVEYERIVYQWNATDKAYPKDKTIYQMFQEQVERTPDNIALASEGRQLSYKELNEKSNQLARFIRAQFQQRTNRELCADTLIALYLDRSLEMMIGILAVLKAGGAYVPMDTSYPQERIDYIVRDTLAEVILSQKHLSENGKVQLPQDKTIHIDLSEALYTSGDVTNLPHYSKAKDLAYVIYTSGTTGKPKGVMLEHSGIVNRLEWMQSTYPLTQDDAVLQKTPYVFDVSVWEILWANWYGAKIVLAKPEGHKDSEYLHQLIQINKITTLHFVPSMLEAYDNYLRENQIKFSTTIRQIFCSGEALPRHVVDQTYKNTINRSLKLHNLYGPTEASIDVTYYETHPNEDVYIGLPIQNTQAYVLDSNQSPVPIGVKGELYIGGVGLARGYLNRPELTKERFVPHPFATEANKTKGYTLLYKTGDLVRWLPNGNIEYLGRNDDQVKIRGFRIELGEVEHALSGIAGIKQCCVVVKERKSESGVDKYIAAYYIAEAGNKALTQDAILDALSKVLPEYMVPSALVAVDSFPLTVNGKLDKRALPEPDFSKAKEEYVAPTTELEAAMCNVWQEVLGLERVGIADEFFRIGGNSILSIQVSSRMRRSGINCHVKDLFEFRTVGKLAEHLMKKNTEISVKSEQGILAGEFGLLPIQKWFTDKVDRGDFVQSNHWNLSFFIKVPQLELSRLEAIVHAIVSYHDVLRIKFIRGQNPRKAAPDSGSAGWRQEYQPAIKLPEIKTADVSNHTTEDLQKQLTSWQSGFDLEHGPLFQVGYLHGYEDGSARIFLALHHMIVDTVSWRILAEDIKTLCEGKQLPKKGSSYRQWVESVGNYPQRHQEEAQYWKKQLDGMPNYQTLQCQAVSTKELFELDKKMTTSLLQQASQVYHTEINDLLLTALAYALKDMNHSDIQGITLEGHGREAIDSALDTARTVGWFTSMFPVRLEIKSDIKESIRSIKDNIRSIPNKGIGFGVFATSKESTCSYDSLIPVLFNYLGQFDTQEGTWQIVAEDSGESMHPTNEDRNLISINGMISRGVLRFSVVTRLGRDTTRQLCGSFKTHLVKVIEHCVEKLEKEGSVYTPGDFYGVENEGDLSSLPLVKNALTKYEPFTMTEIQKAYLLGRLGSFEIGNISNHVYQEFKFNKSIDINKLERVLNLLINSYPELRTVFNIESMMQRYLSPSDIEPYHVIVDTYPCEYDETCLSSIRSTLSHHVYDARKFPLFTFRVSRFIDCDILHFSIDLILLDGESRQSLFAEITRLYSCDTLNTIPAAIHFKDYQDYVSLLKNSKWYANDKMYWEGKLKKLPLRPDLLLKVDPKTETNPKFEISSMVVNAEYWINFKEKANRYGISISAALLSLFGYVIARYSRTKDFLITLTVFNRYSIHPAVGKIWGDFTSTSLFGYKDKRTSIKNALICAHEDLWNDLNHGLFSGLEVQRQLQSIHGLDPYQAVSPIVFTSRISGATTQQQEDRADQYFLSESEDLASREWMAQTSQAWIDLQAAEADNRFYSDWLYVDQLFDKEFIDKLNKDYCRLIECLAEVDWEESLPEIMLPEQDLIVINGANNHYQKEVNDTLVGICLSGINKHVSREAVIDANDTHTYRQVGEYSYHIAGFLHDHKLAAPNLLIGVLSEKGYQQVVSTLGIMQSGAAYLPLHIDWPIERIDEILTEGLVKTVLVSRNEFTNRIKHNDIESKYKWIVIEDVVTYQPKIKIDELPKAGLEDIAYVIFTSGSTGKPKGVSISHKGAVNTIAAVNREFGVGSTDKILALSELSFDLSVYDIFGLLSAGGTIVFPDQNKVKEPGHWYELIKEQGITLWNTVPQLMNLLTDYAHDTNGSLHMLRLVLMSGDWIPTKLPGQIKAISSGIKVMSLGGATEGSIWSIWYEIKEVNPLWNSIPYGYAMPNQKMYVLNSFQEHCPVGVTGDIYIGGEGVAIGYWNDAEKTRSSFFKHTSLGWIYRTGDLGKWNKAGYIEFEGRKDNQVKLNGYRVELEEISSKLANIKGVNKVVVAVQDNQLTAFLVPDKANHNNLDIEEKSQDTIILDKKERELFRLEQRAIKKDVSPVYEFKELRLDEKKYRLRKSYRQFVSGDTKLSKEEINQLIASGLPVDVDNESNRRIGDSGKECAWSADKIKRIVEPLSALKLEDKLLPKYLYPSGGSTYPLQCYIEIAEDIDNGTIKKGCYYYHPISHYFADSNLPVVHQMNLSSQNKNGKSLSPVVLRFELFKPAIAPLYGAEALRLAWLEMGHILALLGQQLIRENIYGELKILDTENGDYHQFVEIALCIHANNLSDAKRWMIITQENNPECVIDYLVKSQQGFECADSQEIRLPEMDILTKISETGQILESSQGLIIFKGSNSPYELIRSGYQAQLLTDQLYSKNIGSCALGFIPYPQTNYCVAIGKITENDKLLPEVLVKKALLEDHCNRYLNQYLPTYMVPAHYLILEEIPLTPNGKVDYKKLPKPEVAAKEFVEPTTELEIKICQIWKKTLNLERVGITDDFFRIGGNSILIIQLHHKLHQLAEFKHISVADLFKYNSIEKLIQSIQKGNKTEYKLQGGVSQPGAHEIAIIGLSGAFSGVDTVEEFWELIATQKEGMRLYSKEECRQSGVETALLENPDYVPVAGKVKDIELFDPSFWDISPNEAKQMDPHIRKFIEHCWNVLESSGYVHQRKKKNIGVFAGSGTGSSSYFNENILNGEMAGQINLFDAVSSNSKDSLATKVAFLLGLTGPAISVNTFCSTGLVSVVEACQKLQLGACDMALAGGVSLTMPDQIGYVYQEGMINSKDGHCRTFDAQASGTTWGSGVGVVLIKRLADAVRDNDDIIAVIKGYATNNDGDRKTGFTAPSIIGQSECIINAQKMVGVSPDQIDYVECHGTGTHLGDPIEINALREAFAYNQPKSSTLKYTTVLGAVKANIGHTDSAAGTAGLLKVCLMMRNNTMPGQVNYSLPNPELHLEQTHFEIIMENRAWMPDRGKQRLAGVSSFGIGGTNAHVIIGDYLVKAPHVEESKGAVPVDEQSESTERYIVPLSAKSRESLDRFKKKVLQYLTETQEDKHAISLRDLAYTLQERRERFDYRCAFSAKSKEELLRVLEMDTSYAQVTAGSNAKIVFMFPGQGGQYTHMARGLYENDTSFRKTVDRLIALANKYLDIDLAEVMYPRDAASPYDINETQWSQIALFIIEYSLANYLEQLGVKADAYIGHSIGEYVAATLSGVFVLEDAVKAVIARGKLMQSMQRGRMLAVNAAEAGIGAMVREYNCEIAVINSLEDVVVSGTEEAIARLNDALEKKEIVAVLLHTSHAYHSRMMEKAAEEFEEVLKKIPLYKPAREFVSNVSGEIAQEEVTKAGYWSKQLRNTVRFAQGISTLGKRFNNNINFIEVGAGKALSTFVGKYKTANDHKTIQTVNLLPSAKEAKENEGQSYRAIANKEDMIAKLWMHGVISKANDVGLFEGAKLQSGLPGYQFNHQKCWLRKNSKTVINKINSIDDILYKRLWERDELKVSFDAAENIKNKNVLVFVNDKNIQETGTNELLHGLGNYCEGLNYVIHQQSAHRASDRVYDFSNETHIEAICNEKMRIKPIDLILYVSSSIDNNNPETDIFAVRNIFKWSQKTQNTIPKFISLSFDNYEVTGYEVLQEKPSIVPGLTKSIPYEYFTLKTTTFHVDLSSREKTDVEKLLTVLEQNVKNNLIAIRGKYQWVPLYHHIGHSNVSTEADSGLLTNGSVFLITGGLGGIGYAYADYLTKKENECTIILLGRTEESNLRNDYRVRLATLRKTTHTIIYSAIDIGNADAVAKITKLLTDNNIQTINMVLHAAGVAAKSALQEKTCEDIESVVRPKILGVENLINLANFIRIQNIVNCSSLLSVMPSLGNMEYTAANLYLDEICLRNRPIINHMLTVNLNQISDTGMAVDFINSSTSKEGMTANSITSEEFPEILGKLLSFKGIKNAIISKYDFNKERFEPSGLVPSMENQNKNKMPKPELSTASGEYAAPSTELEIAIAEIIEKELGIEALNFKNTILEIGGNSLITIKLMYKIEKKYGIKLHPRDFISKSIIQIISICKQKFEEKKLSAPSKAEVNKSDYPISEKS